MAFFDLYKCPCSGKIVKTAFCPHCGTKTPSKTEAFNYEGMHLEERAGSFAVKTNEFRAPKKGEYYLSGAVPFAYKAPNDLSTKYRIMKIKIGERVYANN